MTHFYIEGEPQNREQCSWILLNNENSRSTHVPRSMSWHQSSRWSGPGENHWLHGSCSPESFQIRPHLDHHQKKTEYRNTSQQCINKKEKKKEQKCYWHCQFNRRNQRMRAASILRRHLSHPHHTSGKWSANRFLNTSTNRSNCCDSSSSYYLSSSSMGEISMWKSFCL